MYTKLYITIKQANSLFILENLKLLLESYFYI